ncbi:MAG: hypothetical protein Q8L48_10835 [Archangium sp.]|nr:hypothetical protein [Archangium sp.]
MLDAATRAKLWRLGSASKLASLGCKPDNMTDDIHVTANGASLDACTSSGANDAVGQLYRELGGFFMAASRALQAAPPDVPLPGAMVLDFVREGRVSRGASLPAPWRRSRSSYGRLPGTRYEFFTTYEHTA